MKSIPGRGLASTRARGAALGRVRAIVLGAALVLCAAGPAAQAADAASAESVRVYIKRDYRLPDLKLVSMRREPVQLARAIAYDGPVLINFVFTTCSTICSTQTGTLVGLQHLLDATATRARFVTLTIDPDNDTPQRLAQFAQQFGIEHDWMFYTGAYEDLLRAQQAFDVYRGAKVNHPPVILMRRNAKAPWVRVEGFATPDQLLRILGQLPEA